MLRAGAMVLLREELTKFVIHYQRISPEYIYIFKLHADCEVCICVLRNVYTYMYILYVNMYIMYMKC